LICVNMKNVSRDLSNADAIPIDFAHEGISKLAIRYT